MHGGSDSGAGIDSSVERRVNIADIDRESEATDKVFTGDSDTSVESGHTLESVEGLGDSHKTSEMLSGGGAKSSGGNEMAALMKAMIEQQANLQRVLQLQEERMAAAEVHQTKDKADSDSRFEKLIREMKDARVDVTVTAPSSSADAGSGVSSYVNQIVIPKMEDDKDFGCFVTTLEKVLVRREVSEDEWLDYLVARISGAARKSVEGVLTEDGCDYATVLKALLARGGMNPITAQEKFFHESGLLSTTRVSAAINSYAQCVRQMLKDIEIKPEAVLMLARCKTRSVMVQSLQELIDMKAPKDNNKFLACVSEWQARHGVDVSVFKPVPVKRKPFTPNSKPQGDGCFLCHEHGHIARNCPRKMTNQDKGKPEASGKSSSERPKPVPRTIKCYNCQGFGHKASECPKTKNSVKRVEVEPVGPRMLRDNECIVEVEGVKCPTGANVTLIPREIIPLHCFTGEEQPVKGVNEFGKRMVGERVNVSIQVLNETRTVEALAVPGAHIAWVGALCLRPTCEEDRRLNYWLGRHQEDLYEEELYYFPPVVKPEGVKDAV